MNDKVRFIHELYKDCKRGVILDILMEMFILINNYSAFLLFLIKEHIQ